MTDHESAESGNHRSHESDTTRAWRRLEEYGLVGDTETLAVIHEAGSIDWLCWPRFDSPSLFGSLLDEDGGNWSIQPTGPSDGRIESRQVYLSGTNVLLTRFHTPTGIMEIEDFMSIGPDDQRPLPRHLVRVVRCRRGRVDVASSLSIRPDYARGELTVERRDRSQERSDRRPRSSCAARERTSSN